MTVHSNSDFKQITETTKFPVPKTNQTKLSEYLFANFDGWRVLQQCNNTPIMTIILAYVGVSCSAGTTYQIKKSAAHSDNVNTVFVHDLSRAWNDVHICTHLINCVHAEGNPVITCCLAASEELYGSLNNTNVFTAPSHVNQYCPSFSLVVASIVCLKVEKISTFFPSWSIKLKLLS